MLDRRSGSPRSYSGYVPFAAIGVGSGVGGWIAVLLSWPEWTLAVPGMLVGYLASKQILERVYSDEP